METKKIIINKVCKINAETIGSTNPPQIIHYLDTGSITRNKIEGFQLLDNRVAPFPSRAQRKVKKGTILYSTVRPIQEHFGYLERPEENLIVSTGFLTIDVIDSEIDSKFLYYSLTRKDLTTHLQNIAVNNVSSYPSINPDDLGNLELEIPKDKKNQEKIASVLSKLDYKIKLNDNINAELEAIVKLLFDYWFVQFDFPNAEGKPYKASGGKMIWNKDLKREIPERWDAGTLLSLGDIVGGSTPPKEIAEYFSNNGTPWITPKDLSMNGNNKFITKGENDVSDKGIKAASLKIMPKGTILLSSRAPIGYMAISREMVTSNQGFKSFVPRNPYSTPFIFYTVKNALPEIISNASGSTFKEISGGTLKTIKICLPEKSIIENYTQKVLAIFERQNLLELENRKLSEIRDWLLPMLMNGQVKVLDNAPISV